MAEDIVTASAATPSRMTHRERLAWYAANEEQRVQNIAALRARHRSPVSVAPDQQRHQPRRAHGSRKCATCATWAPALPAVSLPAVSLLAAPASAPASAPAPPVTAAASSLPAPHTLRSRGRVFACQCHAACERACIWCCTFSVVSTPSTPAPGEPAAVLYIASSSRWQLFAQTFKGMHASLARLPPACLPEKFRGADDERSSIVYL